MDSGFYAACAGLVARTQSLDSLGSQVQGFFNSLSELSSSPADSSLRQGVLIAAQNVARTFRNISCGIQTQSTHIDQSVTQSVNEVNRLTQAIADINQTSRHSLRFGSGFRNP